MKAIALTAVITLTLSVPALAGPPAKIADLGWMNGTWKANLGPNTLEENWIAPANGSIAAMVRMSGAAGISMWEVITIEEKDNSLAMSVQQWSKGFESRTPVAQKLELEAIEGKRVKFKALTDGSMKSLQYSLSDDGSFNIEMLVPAGTTSKLTLKK